MICKKKMDCLIRVTSFLDHLSTSMKMEIVDAILRLSLISSKYLKGQGTSEIEKTWLLHWGLGIRTGVDGGLEIWTILLFVRIPNPLDQNIRKNRKMFLNFFGTLYPNCLDTNVVFTLLCCLYVIQLNSVIRSSIYILYLFNMLNLVLPSTT